MKLILTILVVVFSSSNFAAAKWEERGCGRIELGVSQLIGASETMRGLSEAAGKDGDPEGEKELRDLQSYFLESASNWATIYSTFCKE